MRHQASEAAQVEFGHHRRTHRRGDDPRANRANTCIHRGQNRCVRLALTRRGFAKKERAARVAPHAAAPDREVDYEEVALLEDVVGGRTLYRASPCATHEVADELVRLVAADAVHRRRDEGVGVLLGHADAKPSAHRLVRRPVRLKRTAHAFI